MSTVSVGAEAKEASRDLSEGSRTITEDSVPNITPPPTLKLRLKKDGKEKKKVVWSTETVDNEHLGRKKSKCCCVYVKKKAFGQSDSEESDDDCDHCTGHTVSDPKSKPN